RVRSVRDGYHRDGGPRASRSELPGIRRPGRRVLPAHDRAPDEGARARWRVAAEPGDLPAAGAGDGLRGARALRERRGNLGTAAARRLVCQGVRGAATTGNRIRQRYTDVAIPRPRVSDAERSDRDRERPCGGGWTSASAPARHRSAAGTGSASTHLAGIPMADELLVCERTGDRTAHWFGGDYAAPVGCRRVRGARGRLRSGGERHGRDRAARPRL